MQSKKQRKYIYTAPLHKKRKWIAAHLSEDLLTKYNRRSVPIVKGDTVKIMRGSHKGQTDKVVNINTKKHKISVEGITIAKEDGTRVTQTIHPSNVMITKLNLTDRWRLIRLEEGLEEEVKKEIEQEAEDQIKQMEEDQIKQLEEEQKAEEEQKKIEEEQDADEQKKKKEEEQKVEKQIKQVDKDQKADEQKTGAPSKKKINFTDIPGIGEKTAEKIKQAGITPKDLLTMTAKDLAKIEGIGESTAKKIEEEIKKMRD